MTLETWTHSPAWLAIGRTMIQTAWAGLLVGLAMGIARRLLRTAGPETRYAVALAGLIVLAALPVVLFLRLYEPEDRPTRPGIARSGEIATDQAPTPAIDRPTPAGPPRPFLDRSEAGPSPGRWLDRAIPLLPWAWLLGSMASMAVLATGLVGVERLRASGVPGDDGEADRLCRALAEQLGVLKRVGVLACDRLAGPVLLGIFRPLILLPPEAFQTWTMEQVEMALLHELAHLRRWDNHVNLLQRAIESLLFFHPAAWWLSGWIRLERELCCDRVVVEQTGRPLAYAEMLATLATTPRGAALGMADRQVTARIRKILNLKDKDRPMRMPLTLPEGCGLIAAAGVAALALALSTHAGTPDGPETPADLVRLEIRKVAADVLKGEADPKDKEKDDEDGDERGETLATVAQAQGQAGDLDGVRATLARAFAEVDRPEARGSYPQRVASLIEIASILREAGDPAGARAALERITRLVDAIQVDPTKQSQVAEIAPGQAYVAEPSPALAQVELLMGLADQRIKLGDLEAARPLLRRAIPLMKAQEGPTRWLFLGGIVAALDQAGDREGTSAAIDDLLRDASALPEGQPRNQALGYIARAIAEAGRLDRALEVASSLETSKATATALNRVLEAFTANDPEDNGTRFDMAGINFLVGAPAVVLKDREAARLALPKIAAAVSGLNDPLARGRLLTTIAHLQAMSGDPLGAELTADAIPDIKRADFPGPADGYYDFIKPATLALVARYQAGPKAEALLRRAADQARAIATEDQEMYARIYVAGELARGDHLDDARSLIEGAARIALRQEEPRRSRCLAAIVAIQARVGDLERATANAGEVRDFPGLEKQKALGALANRLEKAGDVAGSRKVLRGALAVAEAMPPAHPRIGREVASLGFYGRGSFSNPDHEIEPTLVMFLKRTQPVEILTKLGDLDEALKRVRAMPDEQTRDSCLGVISGILASRGDIRAALDVASIIKDPGQRMYAVQATALPLKGGKFAK